MRPEMAFTSAAECDLIVEQALAVLEETGLRFGPCAALDERTVARLPRSVLLLSGASTRCAGARTQHPDPRPQGRTGGGGASVGAPRYDGQANADGESPHLDRSHLTGQQTEVLT